MSRSKLKAKFEMIDTKKPRSFARYLLWSGLNVDKQGAVTATSLIFLRIAEVIKAVLCVDYKILSVFGYLWPA